MAADNLLFKKYNKGHGMYYPVCEILYIYKRSSTRPVDTKRRTVGPRSIRVSEPFSKKLYDLCLNSIFYLQWRQWIYPILLTMAEVGLSSVTYNGGCG